MKKRHDISSELIRRTFYLVAALFIISAMSVTVHAIASVPISAANPGHNSTQIFISYSKCPSNQYISLQDALNNRYLTSSSISTSFCQSLPLASPYELASKILITNSGHKMSLQEAITNNKFSLSPTADGTVTTVPAGGEPADRVNVYAYGAITSLQNAIANSQYSACNIGLGYIWDYNQGACVFAYTYSWFTGAWGGSNRCPTTLWRRLVYCERSDGIRVADSYCSGSKPANSATTTCTWNDQGAFASCSPYNNVYCGTSLCFGYSQCSGVIGTSCSSYNTGSFCEESCGCGFLCSGQSPHKIRCATNSP